MGIPDRSDLEFVEKFENCGFQKACWTHEAHVRMAWVQLCRYSPHATALERIRAGIQRFNEFVQADGYHETVTVAFTQLVHSRMLGLDPTHNWTEFAASHPDLFFKTPPSLSKFYSSERLATTDARQAFVAPDLAPLPTVGTIRAAMPEDTEAILSIYAPYIEEGPVSFEGAVPSAEDFGRRIAEYQAVAPWLVFESEGRIIGYAYASKHRTREAYQWAVEVSTYVAKPFHRSGVARTLYLRLLGELKRRGYFVALAGITLPNPASVALHESLGFEPVAKYPNIGFKHGGWHDVGWWQKTLRPLATPYPIK